MNEWVTVLRAADAAARWHVHQRRKGSAQEPYINHLLEVASLVAEATHGKDPDLVVAALLHDAVEDQEVSADLIAREFGSKVAAIEARTLLRADKTMTDQAVAGQLRALADDYQNRAEKASHVDAEKELARSTASTEHE